MFALRKCARELPMTIKHKLMLAVCVVLHLGVLWNVWDANKLTPRIVRVDLCIE